MTWLGLLNFVVLQWFGVRLARVFQRDVWTAGSPRVFVGFRLLRWIVPLTWWSNYRWIARRP